MVLPLVRGVVFFHDVGLDPAAGVDLQALAGRPQPDFACSGGTGTNRPGPPAGLPRRLGKAAECFPQFAGMGIIEISGIVDAVQGKQNCLAGLGAVEVIFQKGYYSLCHKKSIGLRTRAAWPLALLRHRRDRHCHNACNGSPNAHHRRWTLKTLGIIIAAVAALTFAGPGMYLLIDRVRTGELFRQKKLLPIAMGAGLAAIAGALIVSSN
ncbi:MAG: hypothetical protein JWO49_888 [Arthrobacter sp.]|nr:hypothetical protein [Arthrobacter sp.]